MRRSVPLGDAANILAPARASHMMSLDLRATPLSRRVRTRLGALTNSEDDGSFSTDCFLPPPSLPPSRTLRVAGSTVPQAQGRVPRRRRGSRRRFFRSRPASLSNAVATSRKERSTKVYLSNS